MKINLFPRAREILQHDESCLNGCAIISLKIGFCVRMEDGSALHSASRNESLCDLMTSWCSLRNPVKEIFNVDNYTTNNLKTVRNLQLNNLRSS